MPIRKKARNARKQPEQEIVTAAHNISGFLRKQQKAISIVLAAAGALLLIVAGYWFKKSMDERKAAPLFADAYEQYSPSAGGNTDYARALELFREVAGKYPSSQSGAMARLYAANSLMNLERTEEAIKEYNAFVEKYDDKLLRGLAYQRLGYLHRALGNEAEAVKAFEYADSLIGPGVATVELARMYEAAGKTEESGKKYKTISEKLAGTTWGLEATGKVQKIEPAPAPAGAADGKEKQAGQGK